MTPTLDQTATQEANERGYRCAIRILNAAREGLPMPELPELPKCYWPAALEFYRQQRKAKAFAKASGWVQSK